ncbi:MAG: transposase [Patescibacteria group bacterium]|nr:transposase [Patescibacteria group bacterium]
MPSIYYHRNFRQGNFYHIFNRGANKLNVFKDVIDYLTFTDILQYYIYYPNGKALSILQRQSKKNKAKLLKVRNLESSFEIHSYCLMPNHFHILVYQVQKSQANNSIINYMRRVMITYSMYAKYKYKRSGALFQGKYKNVLVESKEQLLYLSKYIHQNPLPLLSHSKSLSSYPYSSYPDYLGNIDRKWLKTSTILKHFPKNPVKQYQQFVESKEDKPNLLEKITLD